jgi:hypothetical protein
MYVANGFGGGVVPERGALSEQTSRGSLVAEKTPGYRFDRVRSLRLQ